MIKMSWLLLSFPPKAKFLGLMIMQTVQVLASRQLKLHIWMAEHEEEKNTQAPICAGFSGNHRFDRNIVLLMYLFKTPLPVKNVAHEQTQENGLEQCVLPPTFYCFILGIVCASALSVMAKETDVGGTDLYFFGARLSP